MNQQSDVLILLGYRQWDGTDTSRYVDVITPDGVFLRSCNSIIRHLTIESFVGISGSDTKSDNVISNSLKKDQIEFTFTDYDEARAFLMLLEN